MSRTLRFGPLLGLICLGALGVRIAYALHQQGFPVVGDALTFHGVGQELADGHGFREVLPPFGPTAEHPPLFELFLAVVDKLGANSYEAHRLILGAVGTVNVALIGLVGRALAGWRTGLVAAAIATGYPLLWTADGALMSETLYGTFILCSLLAAVWLARRPGPRPALLLGLLIGLAALTRGEGLALVVLLGLPLCLRGSPAWGGRARLFGALVAATVLVLLPWTIRNLDTFDSPVLISTNSNGLFIGANCPATYHGPLIGSWRFQCYTPRRPGEDEAQYFARERGIGLRYARDHAGRLPVVLAARLGRLLDVYEFGQSLFINGAEGRDAR
ncbi:MAG TPA: glycosyltransferase family 39 protein, partial [Solirubrobacteraceae bacterium]|nr:glycosyltransferase family 39 protein [Solirubrobacteraceae bacterium]